MTFWSRKWNTQIPWSTGHFQVAQVPAGKTLIRSHFGFTFQGTSSAKQNMAALQEDFMAFGMVTQLSTSGSTPPSARDAASDVNPPTERWLWWGTAVMRPSTFGSEFDDITSWSTSATFENLDSEGMVKANTTSPNTLDVYLSWSPWTTSAWAARGMVVGSVWASILYTT